MQYKLIITGPVGSGKTTAINSLTDNNAVQTDAPVSDAITLARKSTTTVAMDYGTLRVADEVIHVYGTPGQERFDFMWEILSEGADGLIILLDNNRNYPFRDLKFFSEQFAEFIAKSGRLIIGVTRLDIREPLLPEVYEDWMEQLGLQAEVINIDPRKKQDVLQLVHKVLDLQAETEDTVVVADSPDTVTLADAVDASVSDESVASRPVQTTFQLNQKAMAAINGMPGVTGVTISDNMGELLDTTVGDESLNEFVAYLSGLTPALVDTAELGPIHRIMLRGPEDDNLTVFVEAERSLGVCSERSLSVQTLSQQVEDMLQWL